MAIRVAFLLKSYLAFPLSSPWSPFFSWEKRFNHIQSSCPCAVSTEKVRSFMLNKEIEQLKKMMSNCEFVKFFEIAWDGNVDPPSHPKLGTCKAFEEITAVSAMTLHRQKNLVYISDKLSMDESNLKIFASNQGLLAPPLNFDTKQGDVSLTIEEYQKEYLIDFAAFKSKFAHMFNEPAIEVGYKKYCKWRYNHYLQSVKKSS